jgi:hypothetical protein
MTGAATFPFKYLLNYPHGAEWTPLQTHYFSENLLAPGIEPQTSASVARDWPLDHRGGENKMLRRWYLVLRKRR